MASSLAGLPLTRPLIPGVGLATSIRVAPVRAAATGRPRRGSCLKLRRRRQPVVAEAVSVSSGEESASEELLFPSLESTPLLPLPAPTDTSAPGALPAAPGIYAVYSADGMLQYMGLSRRLDASLAVHLRDVPDLCASVKILPVAASDRETLSSAWQQWIQEHFSSSGTVPPGNEKGNTLWTSRRKAVKPEIRLTPGNNKQLTCTMVELVDKVVKEFKVVAFVKGTRTEPQCGFSHRVLTILNESGADYEVLNVLDEEHNPGLREAIKEYTQWPTIPQVFVGGEFIGGADILDQMAQSGELKAQLTKVQSPAQAST